MASHGKMFDGFLKALPDALMGVDPSGVIRVVKSSSGIGVRLWARRPDRRTLGDDGAGLS